MELHNRKYQPSDSSLCDHVDHYWIVSKSEELFTCDRPVYAYPGVTPEIIIPLEGFYSYRYMGQQKEIRTSTMYGFIFQDFLFDHSNLKSFIIIQFKPRALSSILPFLNVKAPVLIKNPICQVSELFDSSIFGLERKLKMIEPKAIVAALDSWLLKYFDANYGGFLVEMANEQKSGATLKELLQLTKFSWSTLQRHFRNETGLSPKRYKTIQRFKLAVEEIYDTRNNDWMHYVHKYGYFDQSHFIKEIKRFTSFTPSQLLVTPGLRSFRPENL